MDVLCRCFRRAATPQNSRSLLFEEAAVTGLQKASLPSRYRDQDYASGHTYALFCTERAKSPKSSEDRRNATLGDPSKTQRSKL